MPLFSNIIAPLIAGLFFFLYFLYFTINNPSKVVSYRYFLVFLIGLSLFSLGRPMQLLLGPYPIPLIIVNIRMVLLCFVISPVIILASDVFNKKKNRGTQIILIAGCVLLGIIYVVFNTLGTKDSQILFEFAVITAQDNLTPSMQAPYYSREVTILVQVITGLLLTIFSLIQLFHLKSTTPFRSLVQHKVFLFHSGIFIFAVSFIIGSLAKQWEIYYLASIMSALLFGGSVLIDIRELYNYYEKLIPFIKEDISQNLAFSGISKEKLIEMLDCLGKKNDLNTFVVLKVGEANNTPSEQTMLDLTLALKICQDQFSGILEDDCFIQLPLSNSRIGIALRIPKESKEPTLAPPFLEILDTIHRDFTRCSRSKLTIGIGHRYEKLDDLGISYQEALKAQEYAERQGQSNIIHINNINDLEPHLHSYPVKEKEHLLSLVRVGDTINSHKAFLEFMTKFTLHISDKPTVLKIRLYEFIGSLIDAAIIGGGNEVVLNQKMEEYFAVINDRHDMDILQQWLSKAVEDITLCVTQSYESRSKNLVKQALSYMDSEYQRQLSYKDVANFILISPSYFLSLFKQETGYTFVDYLTMIRIEKAKHLLITTDMNITQVANTTGFNNANYFSRVFKNTVGIRATDYRTQVATETPEQTNL